MSIVADDRMQAVISRPRSGGEDSYRELRKILRAAGCFELTPASVFVRTTFLLAANVGCYLILLSQPGWILRVATVVALACIHAQCGFVAHDAVHGSLTRSRWLNEAFGQVMSSFINGLSYSYFFGHNHRRHHAHCGEEQEDPEMQWDVFALYEDAARAKKGLSRRTSQNQAWLIWLLLPLNTFFLRSDGIQFMRRNANVTRVDQFAVVLHIAVWLVVPAYFLGIGQALLNYLTCTLLTGLYLAGIFPFYHVGCRTVRADEPFSHLQQRVEGTRNMGGSWLVELYTGGTNNHIEHHLFPTIPTARLRQARRITRAYCQSHGIQYREASYLSAAGEIVRHLRALSRHVPGVQPG